ncbi:MAG: prolipoprotein diacylglyceryl transferase [Chloroflexi bacterium]|nr:prolipoprotein diacylglyceryl transferase [Chloroflexota bacterium]
MIQIGMDPDLFTSGIFVLSWHGFLSFIAVALAVYLVARWAPREGISTDAVYSTAIWAIIGGIIGARLVHVIDQWDFYGQNPSQIMAIWNGGIAIYGAVLGGFVGGYIYAKLSKIPAGKLADITAPIMPIAMAFGRIGDIINGEHVGKLTGMPWGFVYSHPKSPSFQTYGLAASHPAVVYEMIWDGLVFTVLWVLLRGRLKPDGMLFLAYLALYAFGRFFISFYREDRIWAVGLGQAQLISLVILAITVPLLAYRARLLPRAERAAPVQRSPRPAQRKARRT